MTALTEQQRSALQDLLGRVAQGDKTAFGALYDSTSARLHALCLSLLKDRPEAEDVLQRVYVSVWREAGQGAAKGPVMEWLVTMTRDMALERLRNRAARGQMRANHRPEIAAVHVPERKATAPCLAKLDAEQADALRMIYFEGLSYADLASAMSVSVEELRDWLRPGLLNLRGETAA
ncbi:MULTISPECIES: sigma-70 family RNA polymerase sigma factor [Paracoccus]|uniref:Sigma-70 family RNA polymerase sigma factor n=1 Tax=Paracoccus litorisediminis TaxID=2006130 RepID=A0A844HF88_9RHOB|nr:sigma-70 family RNA polymerase sigma factor [Paracoccus sp. PAR01]MTH58176.1 sigma-70 family RNA polymerase sigma factor [Paracoccus litorisediminis]